ncbi:MAG TPA: hypothetical protein VFV12_08750 [Xanthobacteraceae bacterium]|nr:hypothetical protein [Xanthobacteraceae bacterium]
MVDYSVVGAPTGLSYAAPLMDWTKMLGQTNPQRQPGQAQPAQGVPGAPMNIQPAAAGGPASGLPTAAGMPSIGAGTLSGAPQMGGVPQMAGAPVMGTPLPPQPPQMNTGMAGGLPAQQSLAARLQAMFGGGMPGGMFGRGMGAPGTGAGLGAGTYQPNGPAPAMRNDINGNQIGGNPDVGFGKLY